jgi:hypothetical protein
MREAVQAVPMLHDAFSFHVVQNFPHFLGRKFMMIEKRDEAGDRSLEVDIVLPQRVVGVDE